jgi:ribosome-associated protein
VDILPIKKTPRKRVKRTTRAGTSARIGRRRRKPPEGVELALLCAEWVLDKKAEEPVILDIREINWVTDYFVICHGFSSRQVKAIAEYLREKLVKSEVRILGEEGFTEGKWVLLDVGDVVVHVFDEPVRKFYDLERLWIHAPEIELTKKQGDKETR